jgi:4-aminobutyrate aminotransferase-like enzyme
MRLTDLLVVRTLSVTKNCLANNLFLLTTGTHETIRIIPPLTVTKGEIQDALQILEKALDKAYSK